MDRDGVHKQTNTHLIDIKVVDGVLSISVRVTRTAMGGKKFGVLIFIL
jgi:hypothetical protein